MMALSPIEDRYLSALTEREFPTFTPEQAAMAAPKGVDSVQLASGPSATVSDAGNGMPEMRATPRNPVMGGVADFVRGVRDLANQYEIKDFVPLLGGMGVGDLLVGKSPEELEEWAYGNSPITMPPSGTGGYVPVVKTGRKEQLMDTMFLGVDAAGLGKGAAMTGKAAVKNLGPTAANMAGDMLKRQGLMPGVVPDGQSMVTKPQAAVSDLGFFSAVEQAALNVQRKSGTGQAFLNDIAKGENVKADEIKWIGLDDFLNGKKNVTRDEVQQFIDQNKVELQEVQMADVKPGQVMTEDITGYFDETLTPYGEEARNIFNLSFTEVGGDEPTTFTAYKMKNGIFELFDNRGNYIDEYRDLDDARQYVVGESEFDAFHAEGGTKFGDYTLPGGENYREILLTMPSKEAAPTRETFNIYNAEGNMVLQGMWPPSERTQQEIAANPGYRLERGSIETSRPDDYTSSHWDQPNVLAHIRVNDRVDADGKKMLLIEEVQSDWHQAGRDKGYATQVMTTEERKRFDEFVALDKKRPLTAEERIEYQPLAEKRTAEIMSKHHGVPDAPMKDTWYQLALKRALKYAADNGYERVGITTGARQAERYDLSKKISSVRLVTDDKGGSLNDAIFNGVQIGNGQTINRMINSPADLEDMVGKEIADRLLKSTPTKGKGGNANAWVREISGLDLQVGGEGMKKYYDEVYPKFLEKYGKKWGAKVGETTIDADGPEQIRYVDITPEMRQSVSKGQPLFTAAPVGAGTAATMQDKENQ